MFVSSLPQHFRTGVAAVLTVVLVWFAAEVAGEDDAERYFTILHTNDEHSMLTPFPLVDYHPGEKDPTLGGFARISRLVKDIRADKSGSGEPVVLVSAGDILGGAPYFWLISDGEAPEISIMQQIGYDVITIGNHEFDYGPEMLAQYLRTAGYPSANTDTALVSSNLVIPASHPLADCGILETHIHVLDNGLRLGFFGLLGNNAARLAAKKEPIEVSDTVTAAAAAVNSLREMDADVIIGVTHAGLMEDRIIAAVVPGIDIMVTGHCHTVLDVPERVGNSILVQSGGNLHYLGVLELAYNTATGKLRIRNEDSGRPFLVPINDSVNKDPVVAATIAEYTHKLNLLTSRLTHGAVTDVRNQVLHTDFVLKAGPPLQESALGNFVADAMRLTVEEKTGEKVDIAIQANGVIRSDVRPGAMPYSLNQVSFYDLATAVGLGRGYDENPGFPLASIYLTGNEIHRMFELALLLTEVYGDIFFLQISGARLAYDPARPVLFRIPFTVIPVPSFSAVLEVERFTGSGIQTKSDDHYTPIPRGDDTLYHVVCDYYILSFFPRVAQLLPFYRVIPKDRHGNAVNIRDAVIKHEGAELKFWQAVVTYALSQAAGEDGTPRAPEYYARPGTRIVQKRAYPLILWAFLASTFLL